MNGPEEGAGLSKTSTFGRSRHRVSGGEASPAVTLIQRLSTGHCSNALAQRIQMQTPILTF